MKDTPGPNYSQNTDCCKIEPKLVITNNNRINLIEFKVEVILEIMVRIIVLYLITLVCICYVVLYVITLVCNNINS